MKQLLVLLFLIPSTTLATNYYVKNSGSDGAAGTSDGTAWATIAKVNSSTFSAGDSILFRRGDMWRENIVVPSSGSAGSYITFGAYGTGAKPKLCTSVDLSAPGDWTVDAGNVWKTRVRMSGPLEPDVGNLIFNNESTCGWKRYRRAYLASQGDFWSNPADRRVYLYSTSNPGSYYSHIEAARGSHSATIQIVNKNYIRVENFDIRYAAQGGVMAGDGTTGLQVLSCDFSWIGGEYLTDSMRAGNAFQTWKGGIDIVVRYCTFNQIYDAAITAQGTQGRGHTYKRLDFSYNIIIHAIYSFEFWDKDPLATADSVFFQNNTCLNVGGWSFPQRIYTAPTDTDYAAHLMFYGSKMALSNIYIRNNIFSESRKNAHCSYGTWQGSWTTAMWAAMTIDYNCYYQADGTMIHWRGGAGSGGGDWTMAQFSTYQSTSGKDAHSLAADPQLTSSSDFHLTAGSPCINMGIATGYTRDYAGNAIVGNPDVGAFEYTTK